VSLIRRSETCRLTIVIDLKTISRFALLEYKLGQPERGKTLFEGIIDSHPKRWDMWSMYVDMEARQGNLQSLR
jgi:rRNA biogenesis protein RRP5